VLWSFIPRWGKYGNAAVIHDFLYWEQKLSKEEADRIFLEAMDVLEVTLLKRKLIYFAVKYFGRCVWNKNKKKKLKDPFYKIHEPMAFNPLNQQSIKPENISPDITKDV